MFKFKKRTYYVKDRDQFKYLVTRLIFPFWSDYNLSSKETILNNWTTIVTLTNKDIVEINLK